MSTKSATFILSTYERGWIGFTGNMSDRVDDPTARSIRLLAEYLTPAQRSTLKAYASFMFLIRGPFYMVISLCSMVSIFNGVYFRSSPNRYMLVERFCVKTQDFVPVGDQALAIMAWAQARPKDFFGTANKIYRVGDMPYEVRNRLHRLEYYGT